MTGIATYGVYIPTSRVRVKDIADAWGKNAEEISSALHVIEKSVPAYDEDTVTLAQEAAQRALVTGNISPQDIGAVFVGSESHPYAVKPSSTIVAQMLGIGPEYFAADLEFACKAGSAAMQVIFGLLESKKIGYGLAIGADTAQSAPRDILEYTAAAAAAAYVLTNNPSEIIAQILTTSSFSSDTPDFWRREGQKYPSHAGRFSGEPAYFTHVMSEAKRLLEETQMKPQDFSYCVFHMPNGKFPRSVAKKLGFTDSQLKPSLVVDMIGNAYSASSLTGLAAVLDIAKPHEKIFFVSYGSGAGSDGFIFETTKHIGKRKNAFPVMAQIEKKQYISYVEYLKRTKQL
ncbi:MAG: hydroxymethylglutaryl-CoA synthase [Candidatus Levybacteria bacterium]|nr:hydroxymethylglutaryl-CoA synthase [Candidatus Levybacteria bacterium]